MDWKIYTGTCYEILCAQEIDLNSSFCKRKQLVVEVYYVKERTERHGKALHE